MALTSNDIAFPQVIKETLIIIITILFLYMYLVINIIPTVMY